jgi:release factor glutamine methyltransferase
MLEAPENILGPAVSAAGRRLAEAGCARPDADARALAAAALGGPGRSGARARFDELVARRAAREPLAYVIGHTSFRGLELQVDPRVLIPRPHTEPLVEAALALPRGARVLDLCTGSGAVALSLKHERPDLEVAGADLSTEALAVARANGERLGIEVSWLESDLLAGAPGPWDAVLANPPYIGESERGLAPEMVGHEPGLGFRGGDGGLAVIRSLLGQVAALPWVALEVGDDHAPTVRDLLTRAGFAEVRSHRDFTGVERVLVGRRAHHPSRGRSP